MLPRPSYPKKVPARPVNDLCSKTSNRLGPPVFVGQLREHGRDVCPVTQSSAETQHPVVRAGHQPSITGLGERGQ
jgi:hypothetical protein